VEGPQDPQVLLPRQDLERLVVVAGAITTSVKTSVMRRAVGLVDRAVRGDDAPERADRIPFEGAGVGGLEVVGEGVPGRVGVLDDRDAGLVDVDRHAPGRVGVEQVVVGQLLAVELLGAAIPPPPICPVIGRPRGDRGRTPPPGAGSRRTAGSRPAGAPSRAGSGTLSSRWNQDATSVSYAAVWANAFAASSRRVARVTPPCSSISASTRS
jgi:hypothetical protein